MRADTVRATAFPVAPVGDILEVLVELAVLEVLGAQQAEPSRRVDDVVEQNGACGAVLALPGGADGLAGVDGAFLGVVRVVVCGGAVGDIFKLDSLNLGGVEGLGPACGGVVKEQLVAFGPDDVPGVAVGTAGCDEIGVLKLSAS